MDDTSLMCAMEDMCNMDDIDLCNIDLCNLDNMDGIDLCNMDDRSVQHR